MSGRLTGKVCLVTGATRGIGKGVAVQFGREGAKVYITGRTLERHKDAQVLGSLKETAQEVEREGGICIPIQCDHAVDADVDKLFKLIKAKEGELDILVNNAFAGNNAMLEEKGKPFWEQKLSMWDDINNVGLRNNYLCMVHAARIMVPKASGLIVNISSAGAARYSFNPAYGAGKVGVDKITADCALELQKHGVAVVSLWPGPVSSETVLSGLREAGKHGVDNKALLDVLEKAETPRFIGKCIVALSDDRHIMEKSGKVFTTASVAEEFRITDEDGHAPLDYFKYPVLINFFMGHVLWHFVRHIYIIVYFWNCLQRCTS